MNNYNVTVITDLGIYNYKNVIADNEKQAKNLAASDLMWTGREVLVSNATFVKVAVRGDDLSEDCENEDWEVE